MAILLVLVPALGWALSGALLGASVLIVPMLLALLLSLTLSPAVRMLCRWRLPRALAVVVVMLTSLLLSGSLVGSLIAPARDWMAQVPTSIARIEVALRALRSPLKAASQAQLLATLAQSRDGAWCEAMRALLPSVRI